MNAIQIPYNEHFEKKCAIAAQVGFRYISVNFHDMPDNSDSAYDEAPEHILGILETHKLKAAQTHLYYYHPFSPADAMEEGLENRILQEIEVSGKIGAPWCVWHPRYCMNGEWEKDNFNEEKTLRQNQLTVSRYLEQAERFGTGIALENLFRKMMPGGLETLLRMHDGFDTENIGICWDTGHANMMEFDQGDAIRMLGERIKCTHIHNNFKNGDFHLPPDAGTIDWKTVMQAFKDIGYAGPFTLETRCLYPEDEQLLRDFVRYNYNCLEFLQRYMD